MVAVSRPAALLGKALWTSSRLAGRAWESGLQLAGEGGLLPQLTERLVESTVEGQITDHLGHDGTTRPAATA